MKRLFLIAFLVVVLAGCSDDAINDSFSAYRHQTAAQLYKTASVDIKKHDYDAGIKNLEALNALYPFGAYAEEGQVNLIYAYYKDAEVDEALAVSDRYLRLYPQGKYADYVYYMKGIMASSHGISWVQKKLKINPATRDLSSYKQGFLAFSALVRNYPHSKYVPDALIRMRCLRNILAEHELHIAQFYFKRKAYVAASNRAKNVVEHFNRSPAVIPALSVLVKSYRALGLTDMVKNTMAVFGASYPESPEYKELLLG